MSRTIDWDPGDAVIFAQVVDEGSFTAAAKTLELPKSTVSRRVSRLEEHLGVQLLRRTTRRLSLTDAGTAFHERATQAVEALLAAECAATSTINEPRGRLRVTAPVELGTRTYGTLLGFAKAYPDVHLELELTNRYVNLVEEGYDVALRGGRAPEGTLTGRSLGLDEIHAVASPEYLERRGTPRRITDLSKHDCIVFPSWTKGSAWTFEGARGKKSVPIQSRLTVNNLEAVRLAALDGFGVALLLSDHYTSDVKAGTLRRVLPGYCKSGTELWIVYSRTRFLNSKIRTFADYMQAELARP
jgi:DNA-binding transcriptional LysR family regulator